LPAPDAGLFESHSSIRADLSDHASLGDTIFDALPGGSVTWSSDFDVTGDDPSKVVKTIEDFYKAGLDSLKSRYG
jgi:hypothetical protein